MAMGSWIFATPLGLPYSLIPMSTIIPLSRYPTIPLSHYPLSVILLSPYGNCCGVLNNETWGFGFGPQAYIQDSIGIAIYGNRCGVLNNRTWGFGFGPQAYIQDSIGITIYGNHNRVPNVETWEFGFWTKDFKTLGTPLGLGPWNLDMDLGLIWCQLNSG